MEKAAKIGAQTRIFGVRDRTEAVQRGLATKLCAKIAPSCEKVAEKPRKTAQDAPKTAPEAPKYAPRPPKVNFSARPPPKGKVCGLGAELWP